MSEQDRAACPVGAPRLSSGATRPVSARAGRSTTRLGAFVHGSPRHQADRPRRVPGRPHPSYTAGTWGRLPKTSIARGMVVATPTSRSVQPTALRRSGSSRSASRRPIPAPSTARVPAISPSSGRVMDRSLMVEVPYGRSARRTRGPARAGRRSHRETSVRNLGLIARSRETRWWRPCPLMLGCGLGFGSIGNLAASELSGAAVPARRRPGGPPRISPDRRFRSPGRRARRCRRVACRG